MSKMKNLTFNSLGQTVIPEGYKWCSQCEALTPYIPDGDLLSSYRCAVCDSFSTGFCECPKCGCGESEDYARQIEVIKHRDGCHYEWSAKDGSMYSHAEIVFREFADDFLKSVPNKIFFGLPGEQELREREKRLRDKLEQYKERTKCECPRYKIYRDINQIVTRNGSSATPDGTYYWWTVDVRCPICGFVYENNEST